VPLKRDDSAAAPCPSSSGVYKLGETIGDVMSTELTTVSRETPVEEIAALMTGRRIKRVPLIAEGMLVGIASRADIVRAFAAHSASSA
jgi:CBS domain-containing protein